jgi:hypothetical protein
MTQFILIVNTDEKIGNIIPLDDSGLLAVNFNCNTQVLSQLFTSQADCKEYCYNVLHLRSVEDWSK